MKDWLCKNDQPVMLTIQRIEQEAESVKTYYFAHELHSRPGQFVMLWIPGLNEKPFSIAYDTGNEFGLAIAAIGPFTKRLAEMKVGDRVGIRGPYGKPFTLIEGAKHVAMVGGGYGVAPLATLAEEYVQRRVRVSFVNGARTESRLLFRDRLAKLSLESFTTTDDGSFGEKGRVTAPLERILRESPVDMIYTCGPELMEKAVVEVAARFRVLAQISVERYMKCGYGICGACSVDGTGQPVCCDGPIVNEKQIQAITEFGRHHRACSGRKEEFPT